MSIKEQRRKQQRNKKIRKAVSAAVLAVFVVVLLCGITYAVHYNYKIGQKENQYEELRATEIAEVQEVVTEYTTEEVEERLIYCEPLYDFTELREINEDIYAWITVPGTQVDYPVLQSEPDNYYLDYNMDHSKGYPGCIYTNQCNSKDFSDYITVLYGHNMKNGSMFGSLHEFEDETFFNENRQIIVYTEDRRLTYEIYAAVKFTDVYIPAYYDVTLTIGRDAYLAALAEASADSEVSHILEEAELLPEDKFITLSTCVNGEPEKRYLVLGRLQEEAYYGEEE